MNKKKVFIGTIILFIMFVNTLFCNEFEYQKAKMSFKNFIECELTRTDTENYYSKEKIHKIDIINMHDIRNEGNIKIITGAAKYFEVISQKSQTLFVTIGIKKILGHEKVLYFLAKKENDPVFLIELAENPYNERCLWTQYWINTN